MLHALLLSESSSIGLSCVCGIGRLSQFCSGRTSWKVVVFFLNTLLFVLLGSWQAGVF